VAPRPGPPARRRHPRQGPEARAHPRPRAAHAREPRGVLHRRRGALRRHLVHPAPPQPAGANCEPHPRRANPSTA
jgi:hypothetical protein